ncbi:MAG: hypothetical protein IKC32_02270 [Clostridia bacterium]|nr:hypothetical protein [Clostridia bacterium]
MACCEKFGVSSGGVGEYVNRLNNARYAPDREDVLPRLVKYRKAHKRLSTEPVALRRDNEITKDDLKWIQSFKAAIIKKRDPIAKYLNKAKQYINKRKATSAILIILGLLVVVGGAAFVLFSSGLLG